MTDRFEMSMMGELTFFLGFQIKQIEDGTFISQTKYTCDILKKFSMDKPKHSKTPMDTNSHLDLDMGGTSIDQKVYRSMIGSLLYFCASRLGIILSVCMCVRFQAALKENHAIFSYYSQPTPMVSKVPISISTVIPMWIMSDVRWIRRVHSRLANFLDGP
jgi:hypothetical protein